MIAEAARHPRRPHSSSEEVQAQLRGAWESLGFGPADPGLLEGQLLRPRFGAGAAGEDRIEALGRPFWLALLAVQLAHEASLLHDDVVDGSAIRRGRPTLVGRRGVGAALVAGDQLLSRAYLAAAGTGNWDFVHRFARAVDATIAGEREQGRRAGTRIDESAMREIARGKSGALFGCVVSAAATLEGSPEAASLALLGQEIGIFYQRVDDLLDYCPGAATGKPPLVDHAAGVWTWPRLYLEVGDDPGAFFFEGGRGIPALRALSRIEREGEVLVRRIRAQLPQGTALSEAIGGWIGKVGAAVRSEVQSARAHSGESAGPGSGSRPPADRVASVSGSASLVDHPADVLARHGRSFHFASRLLAPEVRGPVARVYAFCRAMDDAVDLAPDSASAEAALEALLAHARFAYEGWGGAGNPSEGTVARAMHELRERALPFALVEGLAEGVRMDLSPRRYPDFDALGVYTHRVAGIVGLWIAGLAGCRDPWALALADELGRAMQLTNIARDVGEDLAMGRLYLPLDLLDRHRLSEATLIEGLRLGAPIPAPFAAALEEVMGRADAGYGAALQAVPQLPPGYRRAVAVAARVYQGIHGEIRRNGYDTLRRRASTGLTRKVLLGFSSLRELARAEALSRTG